MARAPASHHARGQAAAATPDTRARPEERRRPVMLAAALALLASSAGFAALIAADPARPPTAGLDRWWLSQVTGWQATPLTRAGEVLSYAGGPWGGTVLVALVVGLLLWRRRVRTAVFLGLAEACGSGVSQLVKHLVARPRPPHPLVRADVGSFPSGHVITTVVVGLTVVAALSRPGRRRLPLAGVVIAAVIMMCCRTYLRAHWLTDAFEGAALASGIALVLWWSFAPAVARERRKPDAGGRGLPGLPAVPWRVGVAGFQEGEDGEDPAVDVVGFRQAQLHEDAAHVLFHGSLGHPQHARDPRVGTALRHELEHLAFPGRQRVERVVHAAGRDKFLNQDRVHDRGAADDPLQRLDEVLDVGHPALQQIAAALTAGEQVHRVLDLDVRRQDQDGDPGELRPDHPGRVQAFGGMAGRHPDVHDHQLGLLLPHQLHELRGVAGLPGHGKARTLEQAREPLAQQDVIVSQRDTNPGLGHLYDYQPPAG
jgi:undecaprenyl-diphosphatase